jgi:hypothetical protein
MSTQRRVTVVTGLQVTTVFMTVQVCMVTQGTHTVVHTCLTSGTQLWTITV